jgi:hypothetical protein
MCGNVGYAGARPARSVLLRGLTRLEYRGYGSAGIGLLVENGAGATIGGSAPARSRTAAWKACSWMSGAADSITDLLSTTEARSSSALEDRRALTSTLTDVTASSSLSYEFSATRRSCLLGGRWGKV